MINFLIWLKENQFHLYKDGTWYTTKEKPYVQGINRKFYKDNEFVELYKNKTDNLKNKTKTDSI